MLLVPSALADQLCVETEFAAIADDRAPQGLALQLRVRLQRSDAACPACGRRATRVHSTYARTLADLALQGTPVRLRVRVRRFRCDHPSCPRQTFVEPLAELAAPRARRTRRLATLQTHVGMALGGAAGARLLPLLGAATSAATVLRLLHYTTINTGPTPRVLGVDDWAIKRGQRYGTVLIDLERHRPVDLLPDRESAPLARWLRDHPGVEIISRDRAEAYAEGARTGAPAALQVADRWHLLKNAADVLERLLHRYCSALVDAATTTVASCEPGPADVLPPAAVVPHTPSAAAVQKAARRAHREAVHAQLQALHAEGVSIHAIRERTGMSRVTIRKYLRSPTCPTRAPRQTKMGALSAFETHLRTRWSEGCHDAMALWHELRALGFHGGYRAVQRYVQSWPLAPNAVRARGRPRKAGPTPGIVPTPVARPPSPRLATWWLLLPAARLTLEQCQFVDHLTSQCAPVLHAQHLIAEFREVVRGREPAALTPWLNEAAASEHAELRDFAAGLRRDQAAIEAAVREPWSNGQTEGQVNKIKMLKRQMYGRASVALLRQRLLFVA